MPHPAALLVLLLAAAGCVHPQPTVELVPAESLAVLLPDFVGAYAPVEDATYRGYFADSTGGGAYGLVTAARIYQQGVLQLSVNLSSTDDLGRFLAFVEAGGGRVVPDSTIARDSLFRGVREAGWRPYWVRHGWMLAGHGRAVEVRSLVSPEATHEALGLVNLEALAALEAVATEVDASYARVAR